MRQTWPYGSGPPREDGTVQRADLPAPLFLFFSGAAGGEFNRRARRAPLKNKKREGGMAALAL